MVMGVCTVLLCVSLSCVLSLYSMDWGDGSGSGGIRYWGFHFFFILYLYLLVMVLEGIRYSGFILYFYFFYLFLLLCNYYSFCILLRDSCDRFARICHL